MTSEFWSTNTIHMTNDVLSVLFIQFLAHQHHPQNCKMTPDYFSLQSPLTTVTNGPLTLWVQTLVDGFVNFNSNRNCPSCSGFFQQYMHNSCWGTLSLGLLHSSSAVSQRPLLNCLRQHLSLSFTKNDISHHPVSLLLWRAWLVRS